MAGEQKYQQRGYGGAMGQGTTGSSDSGQPAVMHFRGPAMINMFCNPGNYSVSVTTNFGGNRGQHFGSNNNPNTSRHVHFAGDTMFSQPRNPAANMPRESTPYPSQGQSPNTTIVPQEQSPKYFQL